MTRFCKFCNYRPEQEYSSFSQSSFVDHDDVIRHVKECHDKAYSKYYELVESFVTISEQEERIMGVRDRELIDE